LALPEWLEDVSQEPAGIAPRGVQIGGSLSLQAAAHGADQCGLQSDETTLELRQCTFGSSLFAPLFFDLDRRRIRRPFARIIQHNGHGCRKCGLTWRQLTVAESLTVQPADAAVGYRVAVGGKQWLIYRSLAPPRNRTLLGHNLSGELFVARFRRNGEVKPIIETE
jgi:hypothetical protein